MWWVLDLKSDCMQGINAKTSGPWEQGQWDEILPTEVWDLHTQWAENYKYNHQWEDRCRALPCKPSWMHTSGFFRKATLHAARIIYETKFLQVSWWTLSLNIWHLKEQIQRSTFNIFPSPFQLRLISLEWKSKIATCHQVILCSRIHSLCSGRIDMIANESLGI